jgi:hypothetical protein
VRRVAAYLAVEREAGRLRTDADPQAGAEMLLGACFQRAFVRLFMGLDAPAEPLGDFAPRLARAVLAGLA